MTGSASHGSRAGAVERPGAGDRAAVAAGADRRGRRRCGSSPTPAPTRWSTTARPPSTATAGLPASEFGDERSSSSSRATCEQLVLTARPRHAARARGLPRPATSPAARCSPTSRRPRRARRSPSSEPAQVVLRRRRPSSTRRRSRRSSCCSEQIAGGARSRRAPPRRGGRARAEAGALERRAGSGGERRLPGGRSATSSSSCSSSRSSTGSTGLPRLDDPTFVSSVVFDPTPAAGAAEGAASATSSRAPTRRMISVRLRPDLTRRRARARRSA